MNHIYHILMKIPFCYKLAISAFICASLPLIELLPRLDYMYLQKYEFSKFFLLTIHLLYQRYPSDSYSRVEYFRVYSTFSFKRVGARYDLYLMLFSLDFLFWTISVSLFYLVSGFRFMIVEEIQD
jgi:hypothetical protein